ncbi:hypothetical protein UT300008_20880 [Clostridium perfringens]
MNNIYFFLYKDLYLRVLHKINTKKYIKSYCNLLRKKGLNIGNVEYIHPSCWFDNEYYSLISIGNGVVISKDVSFLTHDYSIHRGLIALNKNISSKGYKRLLGNIKICDNCFLGYGSLILPNTIIGESCIIGAGSVVKGTYEPYSIIVGNPAKKVGDVRIWTEKKILDNDELQKLIY